jgi:hypothetical protein
MSGIKKENERKKNQGRKSEEGIIQITSWKNTEGNKTTFSNRQLYSRFRLPLASVPLSITILEKVTDLQMDVPRSRKRRAKSSDHKFHIDNCYFLRYGYFVRIIANKEEGKSHANSYYF